MRRGTIAKGLTLESPSLFLPWGVSPTRLLELFAAASAAPPRHVTGGYFVAPCRVLGGLSAQAGFHFRPASSSGVLCELELFDNGQAELDRSYALFQRHLVAAFGPPGKTRPGSVSAEMPYCLWRTASVTLEHFVIDRLSLEEHVRLVKRPWPLGYLAL